MRSLEKTAALYCCLVFAAICAVAQTEQASPQDKKYSLDDLLQPSATKTDASPEAWRMINALGKANGLELQPALPWRIQLSYDQFDEDGDNTHSGNIEEFYVNPKKYRIVFETDEFNQIEVATGTDIYRYGDQGWPPSAIRKAMQVVLSPLYEYQSSGAGDQNPVTVDLTVGGLKLSCVVLRNQQRPHASGLQRYCFQPRTSILRYSYWMQPDEIFYNGIFQWDDRYLARDIEIVHGTKPFLKIHLDNIESASHFEDSLFTPPTGTTGPLGGVVSVPFAILQKEYLLSRGFFPRVPRGAHGRVNVKFTVDEEGHVVQATGIDGPKELCRGVEEMIMKWQFRPFLLLGKPVKVESATFYIFQ